MNIWLKHGQIIICQNYLKIIQRKLPIAAKRSISFLEFFSKNFYESISSLVYFSNHSFNNRNNRFTSFNCFSKIIFWDFSSALDVKNIKQSKKLSFFNLTLKSLLLTSIFWLLDMDLKYFLEFIKINKSGCLFPVVLNIAFDCPRYGAIVCLLDQIFTEIFKEFFNSLIKKWISQAMAGLSQLQAALKNLYFISCFAFLIPSNF